MARQNRSCGEKAAPRHPVRRHYFAAGAEALARLIQIEIETSPHGEILKLDLRNFFNELCRRVIVEGAELADPLFALYVGGLYGELTTCV